MCHYREWPKDQRKGPGDRKKAITAKGNLYVTSRAPPEPHRAGTGPRKQTIKSNLPGRLASVVVCTGRAHTALHRLRDIMTPELQSREAGQRVQLESSQTLPA